MTPLVPGRSDAGWLEEEGRRLVELARGAVNPGCGFAWLDAAGRPDHGRPVHTWITTRMVHVLSLAALRADLKAADAAAHGVRALAGPLRDERHGGWFASVRPDGSGPVDTTKAAYAHAFVALAAGSATAAGIPGGREVLEDAVQVVEDRFLDATGRVVDGYPRDLGEPEAYRGANSSMHMVEAMLALGDVLADPAWHLRALRVAEHLVHDVARGHGYRLPEHFAADWTPRPEYGAQDPADPFRPYGSTPGHLLEWSRLLLHLEASLLEPPGWLLEDSRALFAAAVRTGWAVDGAAGFVYTVDWSDRPAVRARMHWVHAEAIAAAAALAARTGGAEYPRWYETWWRYARAHLIDRERGGWHHELDPGNRPATTVWEGKPDVYHAYQATLLPRLRLAPSAAVQLQLTPL